MKKFLLVLLLLSLTSLLTGCNDTVKNPETKPVSTAPSLEDKNSQVANTENTNHIPDNEQDSVDYSKVQGVWKLKVGRDEELYRMTTMIEYYGSTGIHIAKVNQNEVQGSIHSVQGPPSYRQAEVAFSGVIEESILRTTYEDIAWEYSGTMELRFEKDRIVAKIDRDRTDTSPMWGIPEGEFVFIRAIETEKVEVASEEKAALETFLRPTTKEVLKPFEEGALTDELMINFACKNLALGIIDQNNYGDRVVQGSDIVFEESVLDHIIKTYFNSAVKKHRAYEIGTYQNRKYTVPALGGVTEYPQLQLMFKDSENPDIYYAIVDYIVEHPEEGRKLEYQYLVRLQKSDAYIIRAIKEVEYPIDFTLFNS